MQETQGRPLTRQQFWTMHLMRCDQCRTDWLEIFQDTPSIRRTKEMERLIYANHEGSMIA